VKQDEGRAERAAGHQLDKEIGDAKRREIGIQLDAVPKRALMIIFAPTPATRSRRTTPSPAVGRERPAGW